MSKRFKQSWAMLHEEVRETEESATLLKGELAKQFGKVQIIKFVVDKETNLYNYAVRGFKKK